MENHGLGTHNDKMCAESSTGNTPNTPQFIRPICHNWPIIWDIFEKNSYHMSIIKKLRMNTYLARSQGSYSICVYATNYECYDEINDL